MAGDSITQREVTRRQLIAGGVGAVGGLVVGGLAGGALAPKATGTSGGSRGSIKVVGIFPIGGAIASDGKEMQTGVKMAVDEINAAGGLIGYHLDYVVIDDKDSSTDQITTAFNRAVSVEKADVIFSGYHLASGPEFDIVANAGALYYNVNTQVAWVTRYKSAPSKYWGIFQCDPTESWYGQGFAYWVDGALRAGQLNVSAKTYSIISGKSTYGTVIASGFDSVMKQLGWSQVSNDGVSEGAVPDWGSVLSKVKQAHPSVLFTSDFSPADDAAMAKAWSASPTKTLLYQQYGPSVPEYLNLAGPAANGIVWATVLGLLPDETLPEVDFALAQHFRTSHDLDGSSNLASLIARYATAAILPQITENLDAHIGKWACAIQNPILAYVLRVSPASARPRIQQAITAQLVTMGSAGAKAMAVVRGEADVYAHSGGQFEWDSAAPVAVAAAAGLHVSRLDGSVLRYNEPDPYLPDLLICRPELAGTVLDALSCRPS